MVVILSPSALGAVRMTVDEYLAADLPAGHRYELVEGVAHVSPVPGIAQDRAVARLHRLLTLYAERRPDLVAHITQRSAVTLPQRHVVREPDLA
jgi:Uma2 family endonuclease